MWARLALAVAAGLLPAADDKDPTKTPERDKLQGTWVIVSRSLRGDKLIFKGDKFVYRSKQYGESEGTFKLHPDSEPKGIDLTPDLKGGEAAARHLPAGGRQADAVPERPRQGAAPGVRAGAAPGGSPDRAEAAPPLALAPDRNRPQGIRLRPGGTP